MVTVAGTIFPFITNRIIQSDLDDYCKEFSARTELPYRQNIVQLYVEELMISKSDSDIDVTDDSLMAMLEHKIVVPRDTPNRSNLGVSFVSININSMVAVRLTEDRIFISIIPVGSREQPGILNKLLEMRNIAIRFIIIFPILTHSSALECLHDKKVSLSTHFCKNSMQHSFLYRSDRCENGKLEDLQVTACIIKILLAVFYHLTRYRWRKLKHPSHCLKSTSLEKIQITLLQLKRGSRQGNFFLAYLSSCFYYYVRSEVR